jgi:hypothetical protein
MAKPKHPPGPLMTLGNMCEVAGRMEHSLVPLGEARLGRIGFDEWFRRSRAAA